LFPITAVLVDALLFITLFPENALAEKNLNGSEVTPAAFVVLEYFV
jgi:hypothetical protein